MPEPNLHTELSLLREELVKQGEERTQQHEDLHNQLAAIHEELTRIGSSLGTMWAFVTRKDQYG